MTRVKKAKYEEHPIFKVAKMIRVAGYETTDFCGFKDDTIVKDVGIGILDDGYIPAIIWFDNEPRGASLDEWVMQVFGRRNIQRMKKFADKMAKEINANIKVELESEEERGEITYGDLAALY